VQGGKKKGTRKEQRKNAHQKISKVKVVKAVKERKWRRRERIELHGRRGGEPGKTKRKAETHRERFKRREKTSYTKKKSVVSAYRKCREKKAKGLEIQNPKMGGHRD